MRVFFLLPLLLFIACQDATGQQKSTQMESSEKAVRTAVTDYLTAGDVRDVTGLEATLNPAFRACVNQFMGKPGVTVIDRADYLSLISAEKLGGTPREVTIKSVEVIGNIAVVRAFLDSEKLTFDSIYTLAKDAQGDWTVVSDTPFVQPKA